MKTVLGVVLVFILIVSVLGATRASRLRRRGARSGSDTVNGSDGPPDGFAANAILGVPPEGGTHHGHHHHHGDSGGG